MSILIDILLDKFIHIDASVMRDPLQRLHILLVTGLEVKNFLNKRTLFHYALRELVVIGVDPGCLLLLRREVKAADSTNRAAYRSACELVWSI